MQSCNTDCEALLQIAVNKLNNVLNEYDVTMSTSKTKAMAFCGQNISDVNC